MKPANIGEPETARTPIWWIGGKHHFAKWIIEHFPEHRCYVEPFGGGASVLLQKKPSKVEVYNDVDGRVCEFFEVLRDRPWELVALVTLFPYSRGLFDEWKKLAKADIWPEDKTKRVAMWFYLQRSSFSGKFLSGWSHGKTRSNAVTWSNLTALLIEVANRLRRVQIENKDFREVIQIYDSEETPFYCDPPYFQAKPDYYLHSFSMKDHEDLARMLNNIKGKVCLSYYPHPKVEELYPNWKREIEEKRGYLKELTDEVRLRETRTLENFLTCLTSPRVDQFFVAVPKYTSRNELNYKLKESGLSVPLLEEIDDKGLLSMVLKPLEFVGPLQLTRPEDRWHFTGVTEDAEKRIVSAMNELQVFYFKPSRMHPALRVEVAPSIATERAKMRVLLEALLNQTTIPGVLEPYPLHIADLFVKHVHGGLMELREAAIGEMGKSSELDLPDFYLALHDYRSERGFE